MNKNNIKIANKNENFFKNKFIYFFLIYINNCFSNINNKTFKNHTKIILVLLYIKYFFF